MKKISLLLFLVFFLFLAGCQLSAQTKEPPSVQTSAETLIWPTQGWVTADPESVWLDSESLTEMLQIMKTPIGKDIHSIIVIRHGKIATEAYGTDYDQTKRHPIYSCTKSVVSTLVGIAIDEGLIDGVDVPLLSFFDYPDLANHDPRKEAITLENVLQMQAGLSWDEGFSAYEALYETNDWIKAMLDRPMVDDPGNVFHYCSGCSHLLTGILKSVTDEPLLDFAERQLFNPIGISPIDWEVDSSGIPIGGWGLSLTPREMAKLGYLYLHEGTWDGQQIVSEEWVHQSTVNIVPVGGPGGYGYQWWLYPVYDMFAAMGMGGQEIYVLPEQDMVVVFTADLEDTGVLFDLLENNILPAVKTE